LEDQVFFIPGSEDAFQPEPWQKQPAEEPPTGGQEGLRAIFAKMDKNHDGTVNRSVSHYWLCIPPRQYCPSLGPSSFLWLLPACDSFPRPACETSSCL
jgi:hypothetical protein